MDRRTWLKTGIAAVAGSAAGVWHARAEEDDAAPTEPHPSVVNGRRPGPRFLLGLSAYSFRQELSGDAPSMSLEDFIDLCADHGLDGAELTSYYFRRTDPAYLAALRRRATVNGVVISGTPVGNDFCVAPGPKRDGQLHLVGEWIGHASRLGAHTVRVFAGTQKAGQSLEDAQQLCVDGLQQACGIAAERGVMLALENHGGITDTADRLLHLVHAVDSPWLGVNLDTGNFHHDVYDSIARVAPHAVTVQVKVATREGSGPTVETDFVRVGDILRSVAYRGFVSLEYEGEEPAAEAVPRYLTRMREALG